MGEQMTGDSFSAEEKRGLLRWLEYQAKDVRRGYSWDANTRRHWQVVGEYLDARAAELQAGLAAQREVGGEENAATPENGGAE